MNTIKTLKTLGIIEEVEFKGKIYFITPKDCEKFWRSFKFGSTLDTAEEGEREVKLAEEIEILKILERSTKTIYAEFKECLEKIEDQEDEIFGKLSDLEDLND